MILQKHLSMQQHEKSAGFVIGTDKISLATYPNGISLLESKTITITGNVFWAFLGRLVYDGATIIHSPDSYQDCDVKIPRGIGVNPDWDWRRVTLTLIEREEE